MTTRILIADDHPIVLAGIRDVLAGELDLEVVGEAADPATLIELMKQTRPQALISDYSMPGDPRFGDGIKLISFLRRSFPETRLLVLTMVSNPSLVSAMYAAGAGGVVLKSHGLGSLVQALRVVLANRVYRPLGASPETAGEPAGVDAALTRLSPRELEVIRLFTGGMSVSDIARQLQRSAKTVSTQKISAMRKLGVDSDQALIAYCLQASLFA
ncbi:response regulator transcription factor [Pseudoxanthomonas winnipegensis]|uniref:Response regulator transcription factor n=1 Tax=Pseudoxanthomonas winnipegensis TaxID=2480810 RepID=A0A4Q8L9L8_9GAMM|nr:response regulator transcription factor [Pseudoxanthomonas winnipegensis]RZZ82331.1 response regulator transcription factor [Pseudoxanthomonas winnipegensis]TAA25256.1 response regulator transcription factor [Pseudoxanthomonas winnipegensis]TAA39514.1 response regulator transcription factor [Pseudoxanthomonas winnipegensis]TBV74280.1 response regulator transcription factor [Pseudoxanthomonas winnipegensis]